MSVSMSDDGEESFIVLGSSPTASMDYSCIESRKTSLQNNSMVQSTEKFSLIQKETSMLTASTSTKKSSVLDDYKENNESISNGMAASFILGEISNDSMKANLLSQFPSFMTTKIPKPEIAALQNLIFEHGQLKENLQRTNLAMRTNFTSIQKWQNDVKIAHEMNSKLIAEKNTSIATLETENGLLKNDLKEQTDKYMKEVEELRNTIENMKREHEEKSQLHKIEMIGVKSENKEMNQKLSEKMSIIKNMSSEIEKLEVENQAFVMVQPNNPSANDGVINFVPRDEHENVVQVLEDKNSNLTARVLEFEDMKKMYIDELDCLRVNLTAAEELLAKDRSDMAELRSVNSQNDEKITTYVKQIKTLSEDIDVLNAQLEIYRNDFEAERTARQDLAGEKERVMTDLKLLQKRNAQLIEEAQAREWISENQISPLRLREPSPNTSQLGAIGYTPPEATSKDEKKKEEQEYERHIFMCPLCSTTYRDIQTLQTHVEDCTGLP